MKTKIVFVLTSKESDIYLEQLWVSIYSLRRLMTYDEAHIVLLTDSITNETLKGVRNKFLTLVNEKIVIPLDKSMTGLQRSRWLKTKSRDLVKGDMIYIDSDTIFVDRLDKLDEIGCELGAVRDCHVARVDSFHAWDAKRSKPFIERCMRLGVDVTKESVTYNGGMFYAKDTEKAHRFFDMWHEEYLKGVRIGINTDQPSLTKVNMELGHPIEEISGIWNCQMIYGVKYLNDAKILHYYATSTTSKSGSFCYLFMKSFVYEEIKREGNITTRVVEALDNPFMAFENETKILGGTEARFVSTAFYKRCLNFYMKHKGVVNFIDRIADFLSSIKNRH